MRQRTLLAIAGLGLSCVIFLTFMYVRVSDAQQSLSAAEPKRTPVPTSEKVTPESSDEVKECELVSLLKSNRSGLQDIAGVRDALKQLETISKLRKIKSLDTMVIVADYLNVHDRVLGITTPGRAESSMDVAEYHYPAVRILYHIGKPALDALVGVLQSNDPTSIQYLNALHVIKYDFGSDWDDAATYLRQKAEKANSESARQNLLIAADKITRRVD